MESDFSFVNEPHPGGGAAVASSKDGVMFNDILGTTLGTEGAEGYVPVEMTSFGDTGSARPGAADALFTGKPEVDGLGYAFLFRNYRAGLGKWQTADPLGYPDGWNQMAYCGNVIITHIDYLGTVDINLFQPNEDLHNYADNYNDPNNITIGGHGSSSGVEDPTTHSPIDPLDMAIRIRGLQKFQDGVDGVIIAACNVGTGDFAQQLANMLRIPVFAPDSYAWYLPNGTVTYFKPLPNVYPQRPDTNQPGHLIRFTPRPIVVRPE